MSRLYEPFDFLNRGWIARALEGQSPRRMFVFLLIDTFMLGAFTVMVISDAVHMHRFEWHLGMMLVVLLLPVVRAVQVVWHRLAG